MKFSNEEAMRNLSVDVEDLYETELLANEKLSNI